MTMDAKIKWDMQTNSLLIHLYKFAPGDDHDDGGGSVRKHL